MKPHLEHNFDGGYVYYTCQCCGSTTERKSYTNTTLDRCVGDVEVPKMTVMITSNGYRG